MSKWKFWGKTFTSELGLELLPDCVKGWENATSVKCTQHENTSVCVSFCNGAETLMRHSELYCVYIWRQESLKSRLMLHFMRNTFKSGFDRTVPWQMTEDKWCLCLRVCYRRVKNVVVADCPPFRDKCFPSVPQSQVGVTAANNCC